MKLELTKQQADALYEVCQRVGGDPKGPRGRIDEIAEMLGERDIPHIKGTGSVSLMVQCPVCGHGEDD